jgi:hypothetical protein
MYEDTMMAELYRGHWAVRESESPLLRQYSKLIGHPGQHSEPWHALGQRIFVTGSCEWAIIDEGIEVRELTGAVSSLERRKAILQDCAGWLRGATPFLWLNAITRVADAAPMPKHTISSSVLPFPTMFWTFETATGTKVGDREIECDFVAIRHTPDGIVMFFKECEVDTNGEPVTAWNFSIFTIPFGLTWPDDFQKKLSEEWVDGVGRFLKRCAFINSAYVNKDPQRLARQHRRRLERAGEAREIVEGVVNVVKLRREVKERLTKASDNGSSREWQHQWWVSGHYRAQWYPHEEAHSVIWIAPYLKGPSDKPILEKIFAVVR